MINSQTFLLLLLGSSDGIMESETRLQKLAFLGIKEKGLPWFTSFIWEKYGPLSKELWKTLRRMKRQGLINIREEGRLSLMGDSYAIRIFELTDRGRSESIRLRKAFVDEFLAIQKLYSEYSKIPLDQLLNYVHTAYSPEDLER